MRRTLLSTSEQHKFWLLARFERYRQKHHRTKGQIDTEQLPHRIRFGYAMGHVLNDLCASMWFTYALVFYTAVIGISHSMAGVIMVIGQIADAISTPLVGFLSDRGSSNKTIDANRKRFGHRKKWYVIGTILIVLTKPFIFSPCYPCRNSIDGIKVAYFSPFIVVFQFGWAAVQTIHLAMVADLTPYEAERTFLLSLRNTMTAVCNALTYLGQWITIEVSNSENHQLSKDNVLNFQIVVVGIIVVGFIASVLFLSITPEDSNRFRFASTESSQDSHASHHRPILQILRRGMLHYIGFIYLNTRIFVVSVQALLTLYLHESLNSFSYELASVPLVLNIVTFGTSLMTEMMTEIFGRKLTFLLGTIFGLAASVWTFFGKGELYSHYLIYIVATFYGTACAWLQVTALALIAEYIGEDINNAAFIYGYMSFLDKVSTGVGLALILHFHNKSIEDYFTYAVVGCCCGSSLSAMVAVALMRMPLIPIFIMPSVADEDERTHKDEQVKRRESKVVDDLNKNKNKA